MRSRRRRSFHRPLDNGVEMRREKVAPLITIDGWGQTTNKNCFFDPSIMPVKVARRQQRNIIMPEVVVVFAHVGHHS